MRLRKLRYALSTIAPRQVKVPVTFFVGVLVGGVFSLVVYILLFSAFLFGALQALVAAGTLALAGVTSYITIRDRREAAARELADKVYVSMRDVAAKWQDPESYLGSSPNWEQLQRVVPYLTMKVPRDLQDLFERAHAIEKEIGLYSRAVYDFIASQSVGAPAPGSKTVIRITRYEGKEFLGELYRLNFWKSGKSFNQYVSDFMTHNYPLIKEWDLNLWTDVLAPGGSGTVQQRVGGTDESLECVEKLSRFLESKREAVAYRKKYRELGRVGAKALELIERELRKPVAPLPYQAKIESSFALP